MDLRQRVALVTGGGRGIGRAIALALGRAGARVAVAARTRTEVEAVAREVAAGGSEALPLACDATVRPEVAQAVEEVRRRFGFLDVLVNNAGTAESAPLAKTDEAMWDRILATNLTSAYLFTRASLPGMLERGFGRVVNVASTAGKVGGAYLSAYCASKHGVVGFTRALALETAGRGVTVNAVCPGYVRTALSERAVRNVAAKTGMSEAQARSRLEAANPQNRFVEPEEVAALVLYLCCEGARGVSGQAINLDGGGTTA
ncbi:MAG TPA: SDR family NAD(P)-dependent oxidoreductase [Planctomycetota bacterium]|nr:SDR family NAD(P)-dependent oxidoreductase [Planctomycetota bacterium]